MIHDATESSMTHARLLVDLPAGPWIADISVEFPAAQFRILTAIPGDGGGFALVRIMAPDIDAVLAAMQAHGSLETVATLTRDAGVATVRIEASAPLLLLAAQRSGVPIRMPVEISDGVARVTLTGEHDRVAEFGRQLRELGLEFDVEYVHQRVDPGGSLTDRQRELLLAAVDRGYYDVPRRTSLTELADHVGIAKSTCSETLQRVQRTIIHEYVDGLPRPPEDMGLVATET